MAYRSIFLADDWAHQTYFGWRVILDEPGIRILVKSVSVFRRYLILLTHEGVERLDHVVGGCISLFGSNEVIIHDFDAILPTPVLIAKLKFKRAAARERLLNTATYVVDLKQPLDSLFDRMGPKSRNHIRRAVNLGVTITDVPGGGAALDTFIAQSEQAIRRFGLTYASRETLAAMIRNGSLSVFQATSMDGLVVNVTMVYSARDTAFYMYGSHSKHAPTGTGQLIQFHIISHYKERGYRWYDVGGINDEQENDSIRRFKGSLGGELINLGVEWRSADIGMKAALAFKGALKQLLSRSAK